MRILEKLNSKPIGKYELEFVERKGLGHPDYIIDLSCEAVSRALSKYYMEKFGVILHHNVDKGLLVGGRAIPKFGGGEVTEPIELIIAGRATTDIENSGERIPVEDIARDAVRRIIKENYRFLDVDSHVVIETKIRQGSVDLVGLFEKKDYAPPANDTSFGVSFAPLTIAEKIALEIETYLNSREYKRIFPYVGEDVKVMVLRRKSNYNVTIAAAFIDRFFKNVSDYVSAKEEVVESILDYLVKKGFDVDNIKLMLNTADDPDNNIIYITVTGTSAEAGDDGNTGRGNRINGLITPNRQMSMEAVAGKNPVSHVGKIYNVLAMKISNRIYEDVEGIEEVYVKILSQIGTPITDPQAIHVQYITSTSTDEDSVRTKINRILDEEFTRENFQLLTKEILEGRYSLF
jgi:S-adenosylmethionine synthetase